MTHETKLPISLTCTKCESRELKIKSVMAHIVNEKELCSQTMAYVSGTNRVFKDFPMTIELNNVATRVTCSNCGANFLLHVKDTLFDTVEVDYFLCENM